MGIILRIFLLIAGVYVILPLVLNQYSSKERSMKRSPVNIVVAVVLALGTALPSMAQIYNGQQLQGRIAELESGRAGGARGRTKRVKRAKG